MDGSCLSSDILRIIFQYCNGDDFIIAIPVCKLWRDTIASLPIEINCYYQRKAQGPKSSASVVLTTIDARVHLKYSDPFFKLCHRMSSDFQVPLSDIIVTSFNKRETFLSYFHNRNKTLMSLRSLRFGLKASVQFMIVTYMCDKCHPYNQLECEHEEHKDLRYQIQRELKRYLDKKDDE